jgi:hypothetical protein
MHFVLLPVMPIQIADDEITWIARILIQRPTTLPAESLML